MTKKQFKSIATKLYNLEIQFCKINKKQLYSDDEIHELFTKLETTTTKFYQYAKNKYNVDSIHLL
jgi:hypothetical protein